MIRDIIGRAGIPQRGDGDAVGFRENGLSIPQAAEPGNMRLVAVGWFPTLIDRVGDNEVSGRRAVYMEPVPELQAADTQAGGIVERGAVARERPRGELLPIACNG